MKERSDRSLGKLIQRTLQAGIGLCLTAFAIGFFLRMSGSDGAGSFLRAGAFLLIMTPAARVAMLAYGYGRSGEYRFAAASAAVLVLLFISVLL